MDWHQLAWSLLGDDAWIDLYVVRWPKKMSNAFTHFRIRMQNLVPACHKLGYCTWSVGLGAVLF